MSDELNLRVKIQEERIDKLTLDAWGRITGLTHRVDVLYDRAKALEASLATMQSLVIADDAATLAGAQAYTDAAIHSVRYGQPVPATSDSESD